MSILATQRDEIERQEARQCLVDWLVRTSQCVVWNMKSIPLINLIIPDILYTVYLGMLKHFMNWEIFFLTQHSSNDKFNQLLVLMPPYLGLAQFNKPYS